MIIITIMMMMNNNHKVKVMMLCIVQTSHGRKIHLQHNANRRRRRSLFLFAPYAHAWIACTIVFSFLGSHISQYKRWFVAYIILQHNMSLSRSSTNFFLFLFPKIGIVPTFCSILLARWKGVLAAPARTQSLRLTRKRVEVVNKHFSKQHYSR